MIAPRICNIVVSVLTIAKLTCLAFEIEDFAGNTKFAVDNVVWIGEQISFLTNAMNN